MTKVIEVSNPPKWRTTRWIHLVYLAFLFFQPAFSGRTVDWVLAIGIVVLFLPLYALVIFRLERARWWYEIPVTVLGAAALPFLPASSILFVYVAAMVGFNESQKNAVRTFCGLTLLVVILAPLSAMEMPWWLWSIAPPVIFVWITGLSQMEDGARRREAADLRLRNARMEHLATVSERERIARDLHDLLGHSLTAVVMKAQLTHNLITVDPKRAEEEVKEIEKTAREALGEVRATITGWRQSNLDDELKFGTRALRSVGVEMEVHRDENLLLIGSMEHELSLALREAITNVVRHAKARTCFVSINVVGDSVKLVVADDGVGSRPSSGAATPITGGALEGNGLTGMRERIAALGGEVHRSGSPGTTISISVPLKIAT